MDEKRPSGSDAIFFGFSKQVISKEQSEMHHDQDAYTSAMKSRKQDALIEHSSP